MTTRTFDGKCFDLADFFLSDERFPIGQARLDATCALAMVIQESIEDFINRDLKNYRGKE